jgi:hypothetical protein
MQVFDSDLNAVANQQLRRQSVAWNDVAQRSAIEVFHRDKWNAVVLADLVDRVDAGVIQRQRGARFAQDGFASVR